MHAINTEMGLSRSLRVMRITAVLFVKDLLPTTTNEELQAAAGTTPATVATNSAATVASTAHETRTHRHLTPGAGMRMLTRAAKATDGMHHMETYDHIGLRDRVNRKKDTGSEATRLWYSMHLLLIKGAIGPPRENLPKWINLAAAEGPFNAANASVVAIRVRRAMILDFIMA